MTKPFVFRMVMAATGLALLTSCSSAPGSVEASQAPFSVADYQERAPVEVAILPPLPIPNFGAEDGARLRDHVYALLIDKGYTPLAPDFVDGAVGQVLARRTESTEPLRIAALRSALKTDAFLALDVMNVMVMPGGEPPAYRIEARATLVDGTSGTILFQHRLPMKLEVDFGSDRELSPPQVDDLFRRYTARLMSSLPARRSNPGR